jgi:Undecaprenyl-phosphate galactose phosphotransferase WbaP
MFIQPVRILTQLLLDIAAFLVAGLSAYAIGRLLFNVPEFEWVNDAQIVRVYFFLVLGLIWLLWFGWVRQSYSRPQPFWQELYRILKGVTGMAMLDMALLSIIRLDFSRSWWATAWLLLLLLLPLSRLLARKFLSALKIWQRPTIIFGSGSNAVEAYKALSEESSMGFEVKAFVHISIQGKLNNIKDESVPDFIMGLPVLHWSPEKDPLPACCGGLPINRHSQLVVALEANEQEIRDYLLASLSRIRSRYVHVVPAMRGVPLFGLEVSHFFRHELLMVHVRNNLANPLHRAIKRIFDLFCSLILLFLLSPLMIWVTWKIAFNSGLPVFFTQTRVGQWGKPFKFYKFRSMLLNAESLLEDWKETNSVEWQRYAENNFKLENDPRITDIGLFIRRTSIDELPQLWNVIKGEMSLVGPRPLLKNEVNTYGADIKLYEETPPGITGLWQISGRSETTFQDRVDFDIWYVKNWSLWTDVIILFKTVGVVFNRKGAY